MAYYICMGPRPAKSDFKFITIATGYRTRARVTTIERLAGPDGQKSEI